MQPSEMERMKFYEFEILLENLNEFLKEKHEAEKGASEGAQKNTPNMSKFKPPSMPKMPKINMPRF